MLVMPFVRGKSSRTGCNRWSADRVECSMPLTQPSAPPVSPQPPAAPSVSQPSGIEVGTGTAIPVPRPRTQAELDALKAKRSELSRQLNSAVERRRDVVRELQRATDGTEAGVRKRLDVLDERIVQLERDIAENGKALASAPSELALEEATAPVVRYGPFTSGQLTAISIVGTLFVAAPLAIAAARAMLIRARQPKLTPEILEATRRMERMEQAIDAVAVEVERISEGQRFVTQLMAAKEKDGARLSSGG